ncbi:hypothetical protein AAFF_G00411010 [Aldrovandia affinis]|uniref:Uncharacterized protein n=1 Tax=Aldrovandia affinis TaxID=143900 RepID=A0AAD7WKI4_9TELE|nr:hypothetical protein AAFF_G00411010 [Aldrovandia affinis]
MREEGTAAQPPSLSDGRLCAATPRTSRPANLQRVGTGMAAEETAATLQKEAAGPDHHGNRAPPRASSNWTSA